MNGLTTSPDPTVDFQGLFEAMPTKCLVLDPELRVVAVTEGYLQAASSTRDQIIGKRVCEFFAAHPNDPPAIAIEPLRASLERVRQTKTADVMPLQKYESAAETGHSAECYWSVLNAPVIAHGEVAYIVHQVEDVTGFMRLHHDASEIASAPPAAWHGQLEHLEIELFDRTRQVQQLTGQLHAAQSFRRWFEMGNDGVLVIEPHTGRIRDANPAALWLLDRPADDVLGRLPSEIGLAGPDSVDGSVQQMIEQLQQHDQLTHEVAYTTRSGRKLDLACRWVLDSDLAGDARSLLMICSAITTPKQDERAVQQLAAIVGSPADAIVSKDLNGTITSWNLGAQNLYGYAADDIIGTPISRLIPADRSEEEPGILAHIGRGERVEGYETVRQRKDGTLVDVWLTISPIFDSRGQVLGAVQIGRDISKRKRTNQSLRESQESFLLATEATGVGIWEWNVLTNRIRWDLAMFRIYGISPTSDGFVTYADWSGAVLPDDLPMQEAILLDTARSGGRSSREFRIRRRDDHQVREIQAVEAARRNARNEVEWVVGTNLDITERKLAEAKIRENEERLQQAQAIAHLGSWELDLTNHHLTWSDEVYRIFGLQPGGTEVTYAAFLDRVHPEDRTKVNEAYFGALRERRDSYEIEHRVVRKDTGEIRMVYERCRNFRNAAGEIVRSVGMVHDITERKMVEENLQQYSANLERTVAERTTQLRETIAELEAFSYSLSHDLRAPLRAIDGFARILLDDEGAKLSPAGTRCLQVVINSAGRLDRLIQDVLAFTRASRQPLTMTTIDIGKLLGEIIQERPELQPPMAEVTIERPLLPVMGDDASLTQCLTNLLSNAIKFVAPGVQPKVRIWTEPAGERVRLWIEDNGIGIEPAARSRLFQIFSRVHPGDQYEGTGIGLAIVQRAVQRMGGAVGVESQPPKGSRFWLELPRAPAAR